MALNLAADDIFRIAGGKNTTILDTDLIMDYLESIII